MKHIIHIGYDDWSGLYVDGKLYTEGHRTEMSELDRAAGGEPFTFEDKNVDDNEWYLMIDECGGRLPEEFVDISERVYA